MLGDLFMCSVGGLVYIDLGICTATDVLAIQRDIPDILIGAFNIDECDRIMMRAGDSSFHMIWVGELEELFTPVDVGGILIVEHAAENDITDIA